MAKKNNAPDTLPADFDFNSSPDTLPANFDFGQSSKPVTSAPAPAVQATKNIQASPKLGTPAWFKERYYEGINALANSLPGAGGMIGGAFGAGAGTAVEPGGGTALGAIGGAGIGGMGGAAAKHLILRSMGWENPADTAALSDINKEGVVQAGAQATGEAATALAPAVKNAAISQYQKALAPTTNANKVITQKITPELLDRGVSGSLTGINAQAKEAALTLKPQLDSAIDAIPAAATKGSGTTTMNALESLKGKYMVEGKVADTSAVSAINGIQDIVKQYGEDISPESLRKLKGIFDDPVAAQSGYAGGDLSTKYALQAKRAASGAIRDILNTASPDVAALNKEVSFWLNVQRVTKATALRQSGQQGGLIRVLSPLGAGAAAAAGFASHGPATSAEAALASAAITGVGVAMRTPAWRTASAVLKNSIADSLASGNFSRASVLLGRFGVAAMGSQSTGQSTTPNTQ